MSEPRWQKSEIVAYIRLRPSGQVYVTCVGCTRPGPGRLAPLFRANFDHFKQTCHRCRGIINKGTTPEFPELFEPVLAAAIERVR